MFLHHLQCCWTVGSASIEAVRLIGSRFVSAYFLSNKTIHSTIRILFIRSAEHPLTQNSELRKPRSASLVFFRSASLVVAYYCIIYRVDASDGTPPIFAQLAGAGRSGRNMLWKFLSSTTQFFGCIRLGAGHVYV